MNELSVINELPSTGTQITAFVRSCKEQILSGEVDPITALVQLRAAEKALSELASDNDIIQVAVTEFEKMQAKAIEVNGAKIEKVETGVRYDYTVCNDPEWNALKLQEDEIASKRKARESILKIPRQPQVDTATGEISVPYIPAAKTSKTNLKVTIK